MYPTLAQESQGRSTRITIIGDSAGSNIALVLGLGLYGAAEHLKTGAVEVCPVRSIFVISPAVDHRNNNPDLKKVESRDPILSRKVIEEVSNLWKGE